MYKISTWLCCRLAFSVVSQTRCSITFPPLSGVTVLLEMFSHNATKNRSPIQRGYPSSPISHFPNMSWRISAAHARNPSTFYAMLCCKSALVVSRSQSIWKFNVLQWWKQAKSKKGGWKGEENDFLFNCASLWALWHERDFLTVRRYFFWWFWCSFYSGDKNESWGGSVTQQFSTCGVVQCVKCEKRFFS